jgi:hypothetical protein
MNVVEEDHWTACYQALLDSCRIVITVRGLRN